MSNTLLALLGIFSQLSVLAFGGGNTILPEMQRQVVEVHGWMSAADFNALFALSQASPGPNMMIVPLLGWHVAGLSGLLVASLAKFVPCSVITMIVMGLWERFKDHPWRKLLQAGLLPVTAGLVIASAWLVTSEAARGVIMALIVAVTALGGVFTKVHPLWWLFGGAAVGLASGFF